MASSESQPRQRVNSRIEKSSPSGAAGFSEMRQSSKEPRSKRHFALIPKIGSKKAWFYPPWFCRFPLIPKPACSSATQKKNLAWIGDGGESALSTGCVAACHPQIVTRLFAFQAAEFQQRRGGAANRRQRRDETAIGAKVIRPSVSSRIK